jgi:2-methylcitrate dehydratase PrpD
MLLAITPFTWPDVLKIEVRTYGQAAQMSTTSPVSTLHAKFSVPFALAVRLVKGDAGVDAFSQSMISDRRVLELATRVTLVADPQMTAAFPRERPAQVSVQLRNGKELTQLCLNARGDHNDPHPQSAILDKFRSLASRAISPSAVDKVIENVMQVERVDVTEGLIAALRAG